MQTLRPLPPVSELRARLSVDAAGVLRWRDGPRAGKAAASANGNGYLTLRLNGRKLYCRRVVLALTTGSDPFPLLADHMRGDRADNAPSGLRRVTDSQNQQNRTRLNRNNTSGAAGVHWSNAAGKWVARVKQNYITRHLGLFANKSDAVAARADYMKGKP